MFEKSVSSHKRRCLETDNDLIVKKSKLSVPMPNDQGKENLLLQQTSGQNVAEKNDNEINLVSLIANNQKKIVVIYPGQIVWCRSEKSSFWPSMVQSTKLGNIADENQRFLVKLFAKTDASFWVKLENVFLFDGLDSFNEMKNSVDTRLLTKSARIAFDFAFTITSQFWSRAVAEATICISKSQDERLALFVAFSSLHGSLENVETASRITFRRLESTNKYVNNVTINAEIKLVETFIQKISYSVAKQSTFTVENFDQIEELLLTLVKESLNTEIFDLFDKICSICVSSKCTEELIKCAGTCGGYLHEKCYKNRFPQCLVGKDNEGEPSDLICEDCRNHSKAFCFICKTPDSPQSTTITCSFQNCCRRYHINCLQNFPRVKFTDRHQELICPAHECHNCSSIFYRNCNAITDEMTTCIKCPTALHAYCSCIHAGTIILSKQHHICIKHRQLPKHIWNLDYCYVCKKGCHLSRCETCPHSFHKSCLPPSLTSKQAICADCFNGVHSVYGDIVWVKLLTYQWWPAIIIPPKCITPYMRMENHSPHDICVYFFGDHTYAWIEIECVHPFGEDNFALFIQNSKKLKTAISLAKKCLDQIKLMKLGNGNYTNIMKNTPVEPATLCLDNNNEPSMCDCDINDDDPCGPLAICINRVSYTECNDKCPCAAKCRNRCIQQMKYAKVNLKFLGKKGFGLLSAEEIPKGSIVIEYIGEIITKTEFQRRNADRLRSNVYYMKYAKDLFIDAETKGNVARFINHSCNPNCTFEKWGVNGLTVVVVIALKDVPKDTEITCKYDWSLNIPCLCNEENCCGLC